MEEPAAQSHAAIKAAIDQLLDSASQESLQRILHILISSKSVPTCPSLELIDPTLLSRPSFDLVSLAVEQGQVLTYMRVAASLAEYYSIKGTLQTSEESLRQFLYAIGLGYRDNPYHNSLHAADVAQTVHLILTTGDIVAASQMQALSLAALLISSLLHDYAHPGFNNKYIVKSVHKLALRYNDQSPLENYHVAEAFKLMQQPGLNVLEALPTDVKAAFRCQVIKNVLSTDMEMHSKLVENAHLLQINPALATDQVFTQPILIHFADIGNVCKAPTIMMKWGEWVNEEFYRQVELEKAENLPPSFPFDRSTGNLVQNQTFFIQSLAIPLFLPLTEVWPGLKDVLALMQANVQYLVDLK